MGMKATILTRTESWWTFDEYEVAPGYMGAVEFVIPKSVTGDLAG